MPPWVACAGDELDTLKSRGVLPGQQLFHKKWRGDYVPLLDSLPAHRSVWSDIDNVFPPGCRTNGVQERRFPRTVRSSDDHHWRNGVALRQTDAPLAVDLETWDSHDPLTLLVPRGRYSNVGGEPRRAAKPVGGGSTEWLATFPPIHSDTRKAL